MNKLIVATESAEILCESRLETKTQNAYPTVKPIATSTSDEAVLNPPE